MSGSKEPDRPAKAELEEIIDLGDIEPEDAATALPQPVGVLYVTRPNDMRPAPRRRSG